MQINHWYIFGISFRVLKYQSIKSHLTINLTKDSGNEISAFFTLFNVSRKYLESFFFPVIHLISQKRESTETTKTFPVKQFAKNLVKSDTSFIYLFLKGKSLLMSLNR